VAGPAADTNYLLTDGQAGGMDETDRQADATTRTAVASSGAGAGWAEQHVVQSSTLMQLADAVHGTSQTRLLPVII